MATVEVIRSHPITGSGEETKEVDMVDAGMDNDADGDLYSHLKTLQVSRMAEIHSDLGPDRTPFDLRSVSWSS